MFKINGVQMTAPVDCSWQLSDLSSDGTFKIDSVNNEITINDDNDDKLMTANKSGLTYWHDDIKIGSIGIRGGSTGRYGLTFDLVDGDALTWSIYDESNQLFIFTFLLYQ